jgi:hypothetical protein
MRRNCLLRQVIERKIKEEDVGSYWITLRKGEETHI